MVDIATEKVRVYCHRVMIYLKYWSIWR